MSIQSGLKILLIGPYPQQSGKIVGGVEAVTSTLAAALAAERGVAEVTVLCFSRGPINSYRRSLTDKLKVIFVRGQNRLELPTRAILNVLYARRIARELDIHIVHGQGIGLQGEIATRMRRTSVVTVHGLTHVEARMNSRGRLIDRLRIRLVESMAQRVLARAQMVISTSDYDMKAVGALIRDQRVYIPNPVSSEFFEGKLQKGNGNRKILFVGTVLPRKNIAGIIRAFGTVRSRLDKAQLTFIGPTLDPLYASHLQELVGRLKLGDSIEFLGHVDNTMLLDQMRSCSLLVLFSREETSPMVIAQAMAVGKPVVASNVGGIPEMIQNGYTGFLVKSGDEEALGKRLVELMQSPDLCYRMGQNAREVATCRFAPAIIAKQTIEAYRRAIER
jgi:glycosyltransferase involved in cell wall biosynthesis